MGRWGSQCWLTGASNSSIHAPQEVHLSQETLISRLDDDRLGKNLEVITATRQDLCTQMDAVVVEVGLLREDHKNLTARVAGYQAQRVNLRTCDHCKRSGGAGPASYSKGPGARALSGGCRGPILVEQPLNTGVPGGSGELRLNTLFLDMVVPNGRSRQSIPALHCGMSASPQAASWGAPIPVSVHLLNYKDKETILQKT
ncbi:hypothetical protein NDU88_004521 [Pleurodeles waltl]|uniref:Tektin n=1 Tax=Pleurodeles waltl TaxID=8319 RepID=A0AAV7LIG6_PLEWA|nr:hypothetical protein NDU88_004521 [Pleurodeles waltl]